jgi:hypothetical protein
MAIKEKEMSETILPILLKLNEVVYKFIVKGNAFYFYLKKIISFSFFN